MNHDSDEIYMLLRGYRVIYEYEALPLGTVQAGIEFQVPGQKPDSYLSSDPWLDELRRILAAGFRWVRTEGEFAIFERPRIISPDTKTNEDKY